MPHQFREIDARYLVAHEGKAVAVSNAPRQSSEVLEIEPTPEELASIREIRLERDDGGSGYTVLFRGRRVGDAGLRRMVARKLAADILAAPHLYNRRREELGHAQRIWNQHYIQKGLAQARKEMSLHGPCRRICVKSGAILEIIPPNSSNPQRKSPEQIALEARWRQVIKEMAAAE